METNGSLATLRAAQDRAFEAEGIPMVLAIVSSRGQLPGTAPHAVAEGKSLAASHGEIKQELLPSAQDTDLGALISIVQAASVRDFEGGRS